VLTGQFSQKKHKKKFLDEEGEEQCCGCDIFRHVLFFFET